MFGLLPPQDVGDPEAFMTAAITLFSGYAPATMERAAFEIPQRVDRATLRIMRVVLDEIEEEAREREEAVLRLPPPTDQPRTPEEQARVDELVKLTRHALGIIRPAFEPRNDGRHAERIKADLEVRRARNQS